MDEERYHSLGEADEQSRRSWTSRFVWMLIILTILGCGAVLIGDFFCGMFLCGGHKSSKVSRVKADLRTMRVAIESYQVDHRVPPPVSITSGMDSLVVAHHISTPVTYITRIPEDVLQSRIKKNPRRNFVYISLPFLKEMADGEKKYLEIPESGSLRFTVPDEATLELFEECFGDYIVWSCGPAGPDQWRRGVSFFEIYDSTNGTVSDGHIWVSGKAPEQKYIPTADFPNDFPLDYSDFRGEPLNLPAEPRNYDPRVVVIASFAGLLLLGGATLWIARRLFGVR